MSKLVNAYSAVPATAHAGGALGSPYVPREDGQYSVSA